MEPREVRVSSFGSMPLDNPDDKSSSSEESSRSSDDQPNMDLEMSINDDEEMRD